MAHQYAKIIIIQLNNAFADMAKDDFRVPKGFGNREKASPGLNAYLDLRGLQTDFIRADIIKYDKDMRVNAFRRWISVVEILVNKKHYQGAFDVLLVLDSINDEYKLSEYLPTYCQVTFHRLMQLVSPMSNFRLLRQCMAEAKSKNDNPVFIPFAIMAKDITNLNEQLLGRETESIADIDIDLPVYTNFKIRENLITELMKAQPKRKIVLPTHLQELFDMNMEKAKASQAAESPALLRDVPSTLYSHKLNPSFWSMLVRLDTRESKHWKEAFKVADLPSPLN